MKKFVLFGLFFTLGTMMACAPDSSREFRSLTEQQPIVLSVEPPGDSPLESPVKFTLHFSERVDIQSISPLSVALIRDGWREDFIKDTKQLIDSLEGQEMEIIPLNYELDGAEKTLHLTPPFPLEEGRFYLTVTPRLRSIQGVPFNQKPGDSPQAWVASYALGKFENTGLDPSEGESSYHYGPRPQSLVINEILYDGMLSETDGEAFIELFGTPGADISGYEIHLINGADGEMMETILLPEGSLLDGEGFFVAADLRTNSQDQTLVAHFDFLDQFDPQNGPDAIHLIDREGQLWDALCYGEGGVGQTLDGVPLCEGDPAPDVAPGHSLSREGRQDTQENRLDFFEKEPPSPGRP
jgi:hypothetical protein